MTGPRPTLIELDSRRRASLGKLGNPDQTRYLVTEESDGTLVFRPAVVMTEDDVALLGHPDLVGRMQSQALDQSTWSERRW